MAHLSLSQFLSEFGPVKLITRAREKRLLAEGKSSHILSLVSADIGYLDLPESERPSDEELEEMEETRETFSETLLTAFVGHRDVNVEDIYETSKPMPLDLVLRDNEINFGPDGLPS